MPAILPFLHGNAAFDPEATRAMSTAFDGVCRRLIPLTQVILYVVGAARGPACAFARGLSRLMMSQ